MKCGFNFMSLTLFKMLAIIPSQITNLVKTQWKLAHMSNRNENKSLIT